MSSYQQTNLGGRWRKQRARCAALGRAGHTDTSPEMVAARAELHVLRFEQRLADLVEQVGLTDEQRARLVAVIRGGHQ